MGKWIVNIKGNVTSRSFEISLVREDNAHGIKSYGWFGENKLLVSHNGGPCQVSLNPVIWDYMIDLANDAASELNYQEGNE